MPKKDPRKKIMKLIKEGKVTFRDGIDAQRANEVLKPISPEERKAAFENPQFDYVSVGHFWKAWTPAQKRKSERGGNDGGFFVHWAAKHIGCGEISIYLKDGQICADTERMGKDFALKALKVLFDGIKITE